MAYMHKKTFDIINSVQEVNNPNDYFQVDELIALPIQALNRKGYITLGCCAGHPFENLIHLDKIFPNGLPDDVKEFENFTITKPFRCSIIFEKNHSFSNLPSGFGIEKNLERTNHTMHITKYYDYYENDGYMKIRVIVDSMEKLYAWALNLPNTKD